MDNWSPSGVPDASKSKSSSLFEPPEASYSHALAPAAEDDDDDFGDFEDASAVASSGDQISSTVQDVPNSLQFASGHQTAFPPKALSKPSTTREAEKSKGHHPFAGHMDLLFEAGDDDYDAGADELADLSNNPEAAMAYSKRIIAEQEAAQEKSRTTTAKVSMPKQVQKAEPKTGPNKLRKKSGYAPTNRNAEVLFDAEDPNELEDPKGEYGDFGDWNESKVWSSTKTSVTAAEEHSSKSLQAMDLLGLDNTSVDPNTQQIDTRSIQQTGTSRTSNADHPQPQLQPNNSLAEDIDDDGWDDFETGAPSAKMDDDTWDDFDTATPQVTAERATARPPQPSTGTISQDVLPPTNIPPPIILLSLFPSLFSAADDALFDTMAKLELKQRQALLAHPASHQFLRGYVGHCRVLAHIIAGRKLRWKRDQRLSQSMRIGPSAAGGKGGMKLTGLDKSEVAKEDREVLDVLRLWKGQVGKLRGAVTAASAAPGLPKLPAVPDIAEKMLVKTLKQTEGGVTAPQQCALCGLKREERVAKVDVEIQDSFGEWWVQGMNMHTFCRKWWDEFEKKLKSR
jgi:hypothetical protein